MFIGKDEIHQLQLIRKLCGSIEWPGVHNLPYYLKFKSQNINLPVEDYMINYKIHIQQSLAVDFIDKLLTLDPKRRIDINTAIKSEFLKSKPSSEVLKLLLSTYSIVPESNEASHNTMQYPQNVQQQRNMPTHEIIY